MSELDYRDAQIVALAARVRELEEREVQREGRFQALIQSLEVGIVVLGSKAELVLCNPRARDLLGLSEAQLRGQSSIEADWNMLSQAGLPLALEDRPVAQAFKTKQPVRGVVLGVQHEQHATRVWVVVSAVPQLDEHGELLQVVVTFTDITAFRQAKS
jgi:PAS domain S-box-containing protein